MCVSPISIAQSDLKCVKFTPSKWEACPLQVLLSSLSSSPDSFSGTNSYSEVESEVSCRSGVHVTSKTLSFYFRAIKNLDSRNINIPCRVNRIKTTCHVKSIRQILVFVSASVKSLEVGYVKRALNEICNHLTVSCAGRFQSHQTTTNFV